MYQITGVSLSISSPLFAFSFSRWFGLLLFYVYRTATTLDIYYAIISSLLSLSFSLIIKHESERERERASQCSNLQRKLVTAMAFPLATLSTLAPHLSPISSLSTRCRR